MSSGICKFVVFTVCDYILCIHFYSYSTSGTTLADDVGKVFHHGSTELLHCGGEPSGSNELIGSSGIQNCGIGKGDIDRNVESGGDGGDGNSGDTGDGGGGDTGDGDRDDTGDGDRGDTGDGGGGDTGNGDKGYTENGGGSGEIRGDGSDEGGSGSSGGESEGDDDHDGRSEDNESDSDSESGSECDSGKKVDDSHFPTHKSTDISPDLEDERVKRRSQTSSRDEDVFSGTTAKRFITPTKATMESSQKHMLPKIPLSSIPNNPHREKSTVKIPLGTHCIVHNRCFSFVSLYALYVQLHSIMYVS